MVKWSLVFSLQVILCKLVMNIIPCDVCVCVCVQIKDKHKFIFCLEWDLKDAGLSSVFLQPYSIPFLPPSEFEYHHLTDRGLLPKQHFYFLQDSLSNFPVLFTSPWEITESPALLLPPRFSVMSNPPQEKKTITVKKLICSERQMSNFSTFEVWLHAVNRIRKQSKQDSKPRSWN